MLAAVRLPSSVLAPAELFTSKRPQLLPLERLWHAGGFRCAGCTRWGMQGARRRLSTRAPPPTCLQPNHAPGRRGSAAAAGRRIMQCGLGAASGVCPPRPERCPQAAAPVRRWRRGLAGSCPASARSGAGRCCTWWCSRGAPTVPTRPDRLAVVCSCCCAARHPGAPAAEFLGAAQPRHAGRRRRRGAGAGGRQWQREPAAGGGALRAGPHHPAGPAALVSSLPAQQRTRCRKCRRRARLHQSASHHRLPTQELGAGVRAQGEQLALRFKELASLPGQAPAAAQGSGTPAGSFTFDVPAALHAVDPHPRRGGGPTPAAHHQQQQQQQQQQAPGGAPGHVPGGAGDVADAAMTPLWSQHRQQGPQRLDLPHGPRQAHPSWLQLQGLLDAHRAQVVAALVRPKQHPAALGSPLLHGGLDGERQHGTAEPGDLSRRRVNCALLPRCRRRAAGAVWGGAARTGTGPRL